MITMLKMHNDTDLGSVKLILIGLKTAKLYLMSLFKAVHETSLAFKC